MHQNPPGDHPGETDDAGRKLHARLLAGDPTAPSELAERYLDRLTSWLCAHFHRMDPHDLEEIAITLILDLAKRPQQYDPARLGLESYLHMAASRDAANARQGGARRAAYETPLDPVELSERARNSLVSEDADPAELVVQREATMMTTMWLDEHFPGPDRALVQLLVAGERHTVPYAKILGIEHLSELDQRRMVNRAKDRLKKQLRRLAPPDLSDG
ncbi:MAG: hypothetical protein QOF51_3595 [Chloroflexota bacterium]|jgi:hypothetical protein|nr:hypothetical protein [Chloroflexota bacterium]